MAEHDPDLAAARHQLDLAVHTLTQPDTVPVTRDHPDHPDVAEVEAEHQAADRRARDQHAAARARRDTAGMRRSLARIIELERQRRARRTDRGHTPSLLDQLRDQVGSSSNTGGAPTAGAHRSPIALAPAELLAHIERTVGHRPGGDLTADVRTWAGRAGHWQTDQPDLLLANARLAEQWADTAWTTLNPPRKLTAAGACPECGRAVAHVRDDTGEIVRRPALELSLHDGSARCIAPGCGARWAPEHVEFLATVLEDQRREQEAQHEAAQR